MSQEDILQISVNDLKADIDELIFLFTCQKNNLTAFKTLIHKQKKHILGDTLHFVENLTEELLNKNKLFLKDLEQPVSDLSTAINRKAKFKDIYRTNAGIIASLITSTDWQSPSYNHAISSQAGKQTGKIFGTLNDYKRDQHLDEALYEKQFMPKSFLTYLTNSGMGAFTTIMYFLIMNKKFKNGVMIGSSSYFEIKEVVHKTIPAVFEFEESNIQAITKQYLSKKPGVIILDTLSNTQRIIRPDIKQILTELSEIVSDETYIVIDNSCLGPAFNPFDISIHNKYIKIICFESLNKYYQFGSDRVTAGIIYTKGTEQEDLFYAREHSGTNISDNSVYALPTPDKKILLKRLSRFERNANYIAKKLNEYLKENSTKIDHVNYPGLSDDGELFHGSFFTFIFKKESQNINLYKNFIRKTLDNGRKLKINLIAGTSFGLDTSRIYLTALNSKYGEPFVRFSVGTESMWEIEKIVSTLKNTIKNI